MGIPSCAWIFLSPFPDLSFPPSPLHPHFPHTTSLLPTPTFLPSPLRPILLTPPSPPFSPLPPLFQHTFSQKIYCKALKLFNKSTENTASVSNLTSGKIKSPWGLCIPIFLSVDHWG